MVHSCQGYMMCVMQVEEKANLGLLVLSSQAEAGTVEEVGLLHSLEAGEPEVRSSRDMQHLACLDRLLVVGVEEVVDG
jgi:hypothetical protein